MLSRVESETIDRIRALVDELVALAPWWAGWARPLTEAEIARFEAEHGVKLPDSYRAVLRTIGDHAPLPTRPGGALAPLADARGLSVASAAVGPLADPFPHVGDAAVELEWDEEADDYADPLWLRGCLPLTEAGCDESLVLVVSGPDRGRVWRASPSGRPELHPTGLEFDRWYASELERALADERQRAATLRELERQHDANPSDLGPLIALGRALLYVDRRRAERLLDRAWATGPREPAPAGLGRAVAELDLLEDRHDRMAALAELDPPWGRVHAAIAAARRGDDDRAIELFEAGPIPSPLGALAAGYHGLALLRSGRTRRALEILRRGPPRPANLALAARISAELGDVDDARRILERLRLGLQHGSKPAPRPPSLEDFVGLPAPSLAELDDALARLAPPG